MTDTATKTPTPQRNQRKGVLVFARNTWRGLTSMRTALILLFLLALGAMPGALLPQRDLNEPKTAAYITDHGWWGKLLDSLQFFNVYSSVWFSAIYLLLFISLVGCLLPRTVDYARQVRSQPVLTPRNFDRLPHNASAHTDETPDEVIERARRTFRGWRMIVREEPGGVRTISAEKGFLREVGNLVFHFALLGLIVSFALGKMFCYSGQVIVTADGSQFCNSGVYAYDSFTPGLRVDGTNLAPFCVKVNDFTGEYTPLGEPVQYKSNIDYQSGADLDSGTWRPYHLQVNSPLRTAGDRVYLFGNGYSPVITVTYPNGEKRTQDTQWQPIDPKSMYSTGATKFTETPGITDPVQQRKKQLAVTGLFAPTAAMQGKILQGSSYPALRDPKLAVDVYQGDLGIDSGKGQSIFSIDHDMVQQKRLNKVARVNMGVGDTKTLPDGTKVRFDSVKHWVSLQVAHDPTQDYVLLFALLIVFGLASSLIIKRRRVWLRVGPADDASSVVSVGGLARTDQAGYGEEFTRLSGSLLGKDDT
jgi:cytochrome c biogenesis protein